MTATVDVGVGVGLGDVVPDGLGDWDPTAAGVLGDGLGAEEALVLGDGVGSKRTAETATADVWAHGEGMNRVAPAKAGASAKPVSRNRPPVSAIAARPARAILIGTVPLRSFSVGRPPRHCHYP